MSFLPHGFFSRRKSETPRHQIWNPQLRQDHGVETSRTMTSHMRFPSEPSSPIFNSHNREWKETTEAHVYKAHLPGFKHTDVRVEVDDDRVLCIICEKSVEKEDHRGGWHRVELSSGHFTQRVMLPENSKIEQVKAHMDNGVLTITVPKHRATNNRVRNVPISHV